MEKKNFDIDIPCQLRGKVRIQGTLDLAEHYPDNGNAWEVYLYDLNTLRLNGYPDYRPFTGSVTFPYSEQSWKSWWGLISYLSVPTVDRWVDEIHGWELPTGMNTYRIYPGGASYTIPMLGLTLENACLEPDPKTNPLGLFSCGGSLTIRDNVTVRGSLFCKEDLRIEGANVHFEPVDLPGLDDSDVPVRLPVVTCGKFLVKPGSEGDLKGLLTATEGFIIEKSLDTHKFSFTGRLVVSDFHVKEREPWEQVDWQHEYEHYEQQQEVENPLALSFPVWMWLRGRDPQPLLVFGPDPEPVTYHWYNPDEPPYQPHPDDEYLRWDLLEWTENI